MKGKHGLSQFRLNYAKGCAQNFLEIVNKIEMMYQMSDQGLVDEEIAERYITTNINDLDQNWKYFRGYMEQRDDMR